MHLSQELGVTGLPYFNLHAGHKVQAFAANLSKIGEDALSSCSSVLLSEDVSLVKGESECKWCIKCISSLLLPPQKRTGCSIASQKTAG